MASADSTIDHTLDRFRRAWQATTGLVVATFVLMVFGAGVRVNEAGLACPDWPLCFGEVIPPIDVGVAFEFGHRVLAGLISLVFAGVLGWLVVNRKHVGRGIVSVGAVAALILTAQIILGGLTVLELLAEWTVASHLLCGNLFCVSLLVLTLALRERGTPVNRAAVSRMARAFAVVLALAVPTQLVLGGFVSASYAGLACGTWPTCDGVNWFPTFSGLVGLQLVHRLMAYALLALALIGVALFRSHPRLAIPSRAFLLLVVVQGTLGVANVLMALPAEVTLAHTAGAASLMLCVAWLNYETWRAPVASVSATPKSVPFALGKAP